MGRDYTRRELLQIVLKAANDLINDKPLESVAGWLSYKIDPYCRKEDHSSFHWDDAPYAGEGDPEPKPSVQARIVEAIRAKRAQVVALPEASFAGGRHEKEAEEEGLRKALVVASSIEDESEEDG